MPSSAAGRGAPPEQRGWDSASIVGAVPGVGSSLLTHSHPKGTRFLLGVRTAFESHEIEAPSSRWWLCFPK